MRRSEKRLLWFFASSLLFVFVIISSVNFIRARMELGAEDQRSLLKSHALRVAGLLDPPLVFELDFTQEDEGTFPFEHITEQLTNYASSAGIRSIRTMRIQKGGIFFGPGSRKEADRISPVPGSRYRQPPAEAIAAFISRDAEFFGPYEDEWGSFVTATAPVKDFREGNVIALVKVDMFLADWERILWTEALGPLVTLAVLILILIMSAFVLKLYRRRIVLGGGKFRAWVIVPIACLFVLVVAGFMAHEHYQARRLMLAEKGQITALAQRHWADVVNARVAELENATEYIASDEHIAAAWRIADTAMLLELTKPFFEFIRNELHITHLYFMDADGVCRLRVHHADRSGDLIDRATMRVAMHTGEATWGLETGPLGAFTLRYVKPWFTDGRLAGYLELGMELEHLKRELEALFDTEIITVFKKDHITEDQFARGREVFGFEGDWADLEEVVVFERARGDLPLELLSAVEERGAFLGEETFLLTGSDGPLFVRAVPLYNVMGAETGHLVHLADLSVQFAGINAELFFNVAFACVLLFGVLMLLWAITGTAEDRLTDNYNALQNSRKRLAVTLDSIGDAVISTDTDGAVRMMNPVAEKLTAWPEEDALGRPLAEVLRLIDTKTGETVPDLVERIKKDGKTIALGNHTTLISRSGEKHQIADSAAPIMDENNLMIGVVVVFHDVTVEYRVREHLQMSRERLALATRGTKTAVWEYRPDENTLEWDDTMFELYGASREKFNNSFEDFISFVAPEMQSDVRKDLERALRGEKDFDMDFAIVRGDGTKAHIEAAASVITDQGGRAVKIIGVNRDITERKRKELEHLQLSRAVEQNPACVVVTDREGNITYVNPKFVELTGYSVEEALGRNPRVLKSGEHSDEFYKKMWDTITAGRSWRGEFHNRKKNGEFYWELALISPIFDQKGNITHFVAVKEDVTEQKKLQDTLKQKEKRTELIAEQSRSMIWEVDPEGLYTYVSAVAEQLLGYRADEIVGKKHFYDLSVEEDREEVKKFGLEAIKNKQTTKNFENRLVTKSGGYVWVLSAGLALLNEDGSVKGYAGSDTDITERKEAEARLKASRDKVRRAQERYESLVKNVPGIVYRCRNDREWTMSFISEGVKTLTGYESSDFIDNAVRDYASVIFDEDRERVRREIDKALEQRRPFSLEYRIVKHGGDTVWVQEKGRGIEGEDGQVLWIDGVITDIGILKEAERQMERAMEMQVEFTSTVSHELRTPLTAIREGIAIVLDGCAGTVNDDQKDFLDTAKRNVDRLTRLINDVLDFQKLKAGKADLKFEDSDLNGLLMEAHKQMMLEARKRKLHFKVEPGEGIPRVRLDSDAILRVLINLLNNAFKFTDEGSVRMISRNCPEEGRVYVRVEDTGCGIKEEDLPRLFQDFEQIERGKNRKTGGTGLGLAISKKIIEQHGGRIWAESEFGKGTSMVFFVPAGT